MLVLYKNDLELGISSNFHMSKRRTEKIYYIKQRISGFVLLAIGVATPFILDGDATVSLFMVPLGIYLLITKKKIMEFEGKEKEIEII